MAKIIYEFVVHNCRYEYYLCDTEDEYRELLAIHKGNEGKIEARPYMIVSDGFASRGGKDFDAVGFAVHNRFLSAYYIKPGTMKVNGEVKSENWIV